VTPKTLRVFVEKMDCPTEEKLIRKALEPMPEIEKLSFNLLERELSVEHVLPSHDVIIQKLEELALGPKVLEAGARAGSDGEKPRPWLQRYGLLAASGTAALAMPATLLVGFLRQES
jgi:Zn2+/Cd2+-exporting ATPase